MRLGLVLLAGGSSQRFKSEQLKQLLPVSQKPLYLFTLDRLRSHIDFDDIVLVLHKSLPPVTGLKTVLGGDSWLQSVFAGVEKLHPDVDRVLVHDAARPYFLKEDLLKLIEEAKRHKVVALGSMMRNTLTRIENDKIEVLDRTHIWEVYTPQIADRKLFEKKSCDGTDLITFALSQGLQGKILPSSPLNIKITYPEDRILCETLLGLE